MAKHTAVITITATPARNLPFTTVYPHRDGNSVPVHPDEQFAVRLGDLHGRLLSRLGGSFGNAHRQRTIRIGHGHGIRIHRIF